MQHWLAAALLLLPFTPAQAQKSPAPQKPAATKPASEHAAYEAAGKAYQAGEYEAALTGFKHLIAQHPENIEYKKFAAECAVILTDTDFAITTLQPVEAAHPADWRAHILLAQAYAESADQPGRGEKRDEEVVALRKLHVQPDQADPTFARMHEFLLETDQRGETLIKLYPALEPWGEFNFYLVARTYDAQHMPQKLIVLESDDGDQDLFKQEHPKEAAAGERSFSLDGYSLPFKNAQGEDVQTHSTYGFFIGEPSYDAVRGQILAIVEGRLKPLAAHTGPAITE